ncbi:MAG: hypothetical protein K8S94_10560 [Planctomycetia bacterium]|nr:hypothetical protein [Planctomycetia bacterium]
MASPLTVGKPPATVDALNRVTRYRHIDIPSGQVQKRADYVYRADGSVSSVTRYVGAGTYLVGSSTAAYDGMGRITGITHAPKASPSIAYAYAYDAASRITERRSSWIRTPAARSPSVIPTSPSTPTTSGTASWP